MSLPCMRIPQDLLLSLQPGFCRERPRWLSDLQQGSFRAEQHQSLGQQTKKWWCFTSDSHEHFHTYLISQQSMRWEVPILLTSLSFTICKMGDEKGWIWWNRVSSKFKILKILRTVRKWLAHPDTTSLLPPKERAIPEILPSHLLKFWPWKGSIWHICTLPFPGRGTPQRTVYVCKLL